MEKKNYSPAFKAKVVLEVLQEEQELSAIASRYNLNPNMLRNWIKEFLKKVSSVVEGAAKAEKNSGRIFRTSVLWARKNILKYLL